MGVDGSENSGRALDFALDLADKFDAAVTILTVAERLPIVPVPEGSTTYPTGGGTAWVDEDLRKMHEQLLNREVSRAKKTKPNLTISSMLREGDPAHEIVNAAREGSFDVIVVGHRGLGKVEELFLGSVSEKVAHLTPCPLIIVR